MAMAREFAYFYAPTVNSYKRYQSGSFAPTADRGAGTTAPAASGSAARAGGFRVENRIPGADANPYLAFAATIAAGLHGVAEKLKAPRVYEGNAYEDARLPQVPKTLREAIGELERSRSRARGVRTDVVEHYVHSARGSKQQAFDQSVTDWELMPAVQRNLGIKGVAHGDVRMETGSRTKVSAYHRRGDGDRPRRGVRFAAEGARVVVCRPRRKAGRDGGLGRHGGRRALAVAGDVAVEAECADGRGRGRGASGPPHPL